MTTITKQSDEIQILIVDDNRDIHKDYDSVLCDSGRKDSSLNSMAMSILNPDATTDQAEDSERNRYKLLNAYQGKDAVELLAAEREAGRRIPLAFVDMRMPPGWDGLETIERLWEVDPDLQIVICSAYSDYDWDEIVERLGHRHNLLILKKPFASSEVQQAAAALTDKWASERAVNVRSEEMEHYIQRLLLEVRQRQELEERLRFQSLHDHLTSLPNRAALLARMEECMRRQKPSSGYRFCVLFLDLDNFKFVNDSLGHRCGDELLTEVASRLNRCLRTLPTEHRPEGELIARLGGDEFVILLEGIESIDNATYVAEQIQSLFTVPAKIDNSDISIGTSIGIAFDDEGYETPDAILRDADTALFTAKSDGRGCYALFDKPMHANARYRMRLESDLRHAIERRELMMYLQPIISLDSGKVVSFESLIRWKNAELGMISAAEFIPIAEETGQIIPIGNWVIEETCRILARWQDLFKEDCPSISLNVSARQFAVEDFALTLKQATRQAGVDPDLLGIELTESTAVRDSNRVRDEVAKIQTNGHKVYLDDFGTGYSSLSQLQDLPIDFVKIDRSFVDLIDSSGKAANTIQAIVTMSHNSGKQVVVEGLERIEQIVQAQALECNYGQGYFFSQPVPEDEAQALVARPPIWMKSAA